ncbi:hypothetical protein EIM50_22510 [Pseudoxanthomonas sp. SGD-10]|nr:hypothetical protein EIM50_22510 [Pseudoxanthomonas sp. SGD-10]
MKTLFIIIFCSLITVKSYAQNKTFITIIEQEGKELRYASNLLLGGKKYFEYDKMLSKEDLKNQYKKDYQRGYLIKVKTNVKLLDISQLLELYKIEAKANKLPLFINNSLCKTCETLLVNPENIESIRLVSDNNDKRIEVLTKDRPLGKTIK